MMSSALPFSPRPSYQNLPDTSYSGELQEHPFESGFSFMADSPMDYLINTPDTREHGEASDQQQRQDDVHMPHAEATQGASYPMTHLSLPEGHPAAPQLPAQTSVVQVPPLQYFPPYDMPFSTPQTHHAASFGSNSSHPYRHYALRSHRLSRSPDGHRPMSPPLSLSPPGSAGSHNQSPSVVSPALVSPMSMMSNSLSDVSPGSWAYSVPSQSLYNGTPLTSISTPLTNVGALTNASPSGPVMSMVSGFPYPMPSGMASSTQRVQPPKPKARPRANPGPVVKKEAGVDDSMSDEDESGEREDPGGGPSRGLGFTPATNDSDERNYIPPVKEEIKKARIQSEQRRRDELREGFKRLKESLPISNQRSSKSNLLDRSVAHIQQIESANRYLLAQLEGATVELAKLRQTNAELAHAVNMNTRGENGSSPGSSGRA